MKAALVEQFGIENLEVAEAVDPTADLVEVRIATEVATVNPADGAVARGAAGATDDAQLHRRNSPGATIAGESGLLESRGC